MSTSSILLKAFNKHLFEFIDDIITIFPEKKEISTSKDGDIRFKAESFSMKTKIGKKWRNQYGYGENNSEVIYSLEGEIKEGEELELVNFNSWELTEQFGGWALLPKGGTVEA